jgi:hypothetical protein
MFFLLQVNFFPTHKNEEVPVLEKLPYTILVSKEVKLT